VAIVLFVLLTLASLVLIPIGVGQLRYRRWARTATLAWSIAALVLIVGEFGTFSSITNDQEAAMGLLFFYVFCLLPYPVVQLAVLTRQRVKQAMKE
ncbi:hypothetical protein ACFL51_01595, partial [Myxococcota bacterium]